MTFSWVAIARAVPRRKEEVERGLVGNHNLIMFDVQRDRTLIASLEKKKVSANIYRGGVDIIDVRSFTRCFS
jgi:hypothetical protein